LIGSKLAAGCTWNRAKGKLMNLPRILQGESLTRLMQGAAAGAIIAMIVGFRLTF
jgi:hypothetical protein